MINDKLDFKIDDKGECVIIINGIIFDDETFDPISFCIDNGIGETFIFTCSCGVPGCVGWFNGIKVKMRKKTVEWRIPKKHVKEGKLKSFYSFKIDDYVEVQKEILQSLFNCARLNDNKMTPMTKGLCSEILNTKDLKEKIQDRINWNFVFYGEKWKHQYTKKIIIEIWAINNEYIKRK